MPDPLALRAAQHRGAFAAPEFGAPVMAALPMPAFDPPILKDRLF